MNKKYIWAGIIIIAVVALLIQLIPLPARGNNPPFVSEPNWDSAQTRDLVKRACFDCHSNMTVWPWYSYVAPVSWLIYNDVMEGRSRMNFSEWSTSQRNLDEIPSIINEGEMPPSIYLLMHPNARLSDSEKQQLITGLQNSIQ